MLLVFTRMPGESYRRRIGSLLLYLSYVFRALMPVKNEFCTEQSICEFCRRVSLNIHSVEGCL